VTSAITGQERCRHVAGTAPYPWPYDGLRADALALVVTNGPAAHDDSCTAVGRLAAGVREAGGVVVHLTTGGAAGSHLPTSADDVHVRSAGRDGFYGGPLDDVLRSRGRQQLLVTGSTLEIDVHSTLRSANDRGYECLLVADACTAHDPDLTPQSLSMILMSGGIFGAVGYTNDVLDVLATSDYGSTT
jgi:biuret amidohydrolase